MKGLLSNRRRRHADLDEHLDDRETASPVAPGPVEGAGKRAWRRGSGDRLRVGYGRGGVEGFITSAATRLFLVAIVGAVVAGPIALVVEVRRPAPVPVQATSPPVTAQAGPAVRAASTATQLVRFWLSATSRDRDQLAASVMMPPPTLTLPVTRPEPPSWVEPVDLGETSPGEWRVLVRAGGGLAGPTSTYLVLVRVDATAATAVSLPARIAEPTQTAASASHLETVRLSDPAAETVGGFTAALLTGNTDLRRWTSPDSVLQPGPKACRSVTLTQVLSNIPRPAAIDGLELGVLATVDCTISKARPGRPRVGQPLQYPLVLRARDGRWEAVRYADTTPDPAKATTPPPPAPTPEPTPSPTR